jgi:hypothetical protein
MSLVQDYVVSDILPMVPSTGCCGPDFAFCLQTSLFTVLMLLELLNIEGRLF